MASGQQPHQQSLEDFLEPLHITDDNVYKLSLSLCDTFSMLSTKSDNQFLPTPISESLLRRVDSADHGRWVPSTPDTPLFISQRLTVCPSADTLPLTCELILDRTRIRAID